METWQGIGDFQGRVQEPSHYFPHHSHLGGTAPECVCHECSSMLAEPRHLAHVDKSDSPGRHADLTNHGSLSFCSLMEARRNGHRHSISR